MYNLNFVNGINLRDATLTTDEYDQPALYWNVDDTKIEGLNEFKTALNASAKHIGKFINMFKDEVKHDPVYDYIQELKKMRVIDNPIIDIIKNQVQQLILMSKILNSCLKKQIVLAKKTVINLLHYQIQSQKHQMMQKDY